jgi:hypothetical protein
MRPRELSHRLRLRKPTRRSSAKPPAEGHDQGFTPIPDLTDKIEKRCLQISDFMHKIARGTSLNGCRAALLLDSSDKGKPIPVTDSIKLY